MSHPRLQIAKTCFALLALVAVLLSIFGVSPPAASAQTAGTFYRLTARHSGKVVDVNGGSTANGAVVHQWSVNSANSQQWQFQDAGGGYFRIVNRNSGRCLDVNGASTADNAQIIQWTCSATANNQQWRLQATSGGFSLLIARHSGKCLDVNGASTVDGGQIIQWSCNSSANNQQWSLAAVGGGPTATPTRTSPPGATPTRTPTRTPTPPAGSRTCEAFGAINTGKYWLNNNLWGQASGSGTQCVWSNSVSGSTISWGTNWNWTGQSNQVKSYTSSVLGWHWGWRLQNTGLPVQLSANRSINCNWSYRVNQNGTMNVAYDLWLHTISNPGSSDNPTDEVMIWLYRAGGAGPAGTLQATVNIGGTSWDLYRGVVGSWNVFSFIRTTNTTSASLNLRDFLNNLVSRGWLSSAKYLNSIQAGTEVFIGSGQLDTDSYSCNIP